jgi:hypothetical protein
MLETTSIDMLEMTLSDVRHMIPKLLKRADASTQLQSVTWLMDQCENIAPALVCKYFYFEQHLIEYFPCNMPTHKILLSHDEIDYVCTDPVFIPFLFYHLLYSH